MPLPGSCLRLITSQTWGWTRAQLARGAGNGSNGFSVLLTLPLISRQCSPSCPHCSLPSPLILSVLTSLLNSVQCRLSFSCCLFLPSIKAIQNVIRYVHSLIPRVSLSSGIKLQISTQVLFSPSVTPPATLTLPPWYLWAPGRCSPSSSPAPLG